jgi:hypothetical protein
MPDGERAPQARRSATWHRTSKDMSDSARDRARTLELVIRAAAAEERLLGYRLQRAAEAQRKVRDEIAREQSREHFGHPPQDGSSER